MSSLHVVVVVERVGIADHKQATVLKSIIYLKSVVPAIL